MVRPLTALLLLASPFFPGPAPAQTQIPGTMLRLNTEQTLHVEPGTERICGLTVPAGQIVSVMFEQSSGSVSVRWLADGLSAEAAKAVTSRLNRSGKDAAIVFRSIGLKPATIGDKTDTSGSFVVRTQSKRGADVRIVVATPRTATLEDAATASAEADTEQAVALSSDRTAASLSKSLELLQSAEKHWRSADDRVELARVLALEAYIQAFPMDKGAAALEVLPELIENAAKIAGVSPVEAGNARKTAGFVFAKQARYDESLQQYNAALPLFEKTEDTYNRVVVLENRAKVERIQGHNPLALADVEAAIPLAQENVDRRGELALEVERGAIAFSSGQLGLAHEANMRAIALAGEAHDDFLEGLAWSDLGVVYTELHEFDEADRALNHADTVWKRTPNAYGQIQTLEDRAEMRLAKGDLAGARMAFTLGAAEAAKSSLDREQVYFLRGLAVSEMHSGQLTDAKQHIDQAVKKAERIQVADLLSAIYASSGDVDAQQNHWSDAAAQWKHADLIAVQRGDGLDQVIALGGMVRAAIHLGNLPLASEHCQEAMSALELVRTGITDADLRLSFFSSRHALYDLCVQTELKRNNSRAAFDAAERGRARSLLDQAAVSGIHAEFPHDLLDRIDKNERKLVQERSRLGKSVQRKQSAEYSSNMNALLQEREMLGKEAEQSGLSSSLAAAVLPLSEADVMQRLDSHTALLAFWLGDKSSHVWMITRKGVSSHSLPSEAVLRDETKRYLGALLSPLSMKTDSSAAELSQAIVKTRTIASREAQALRHTLLPMQIPTGIHRLLIVKDGALFALSFAALPSASGGHLGEHLQLATEPSATFAFRSESKTLTSSPLQAVVFADPAEVSQTQAQFTSDRIQQPELERVSITVALPFARREADSIRETFGDRNTRIFTGASASRAKALALNWSSYNIAHFATHAVYRDTHLELSGLVLGSEEASSQPAKSSILSYSDVLHMKAPLQLVVLSACNSGVGKFVPGEGMLALDNAFLAAGTSTVVGTLWPVDDEASSVFMNYFYRALVRNRSPIQSLKQAQQEMAASPQWNAPYYWGAFSLSGDWRPFSN
jgi:CHAT domain-containing protein